CAREGELGVDYW
nr:immunoglobulin heavy chain junction region [Mus musculus]